MPPEIAPNEITATEHKRGVSTIVSLDDLAQQAATFARATRSIATQRAYANDWSDFTSWCQQTGMTPLPAAPQCVGLYLTARVATHAVTTLARRLAAISTAHRLAGLRLDTRHPAIADVLRGIRRHYGTATRQAAPATTSIVQAMVSGCDDTLIGQRDRALLLVGFAGALRRSEIVAVQVADVTFAPDGARLVLRRSKTDQEGAGTTIGIIRTATPTCPVRALQAWLKVAKIEAGPVFRRIDRHGRLGAALTDQSVALIVKRRAAQAGLNPTEFSGHSLRAGLATAAAANGVEERLIARQTRHRSMTVLRSYIREGELLTVNNASGRVGI